MSNERLDAMRSRAGGSEDSMKHDDGVNHEDEAITRMRTHPSWQVRTQNQSPQLRCDIRRDLDTSGTDTPWKMSSKPPACAAVASRMYLPAEHTSAWCTGRAWRTVCRTEHASDGD